MSIISNSTMNIIEWVGVTSSLAGSLLNARGHRCSFVFWTLSAILLGFIAYNLGRPGWLTLQGVGIAINVYGLSNWQGDAPTLALAQRD